MYPPWCTYLVGKPGADFLVQCGMPTRLENAGHTRCLEHFDGRSKGCEIADRVFLATEREEEERARTTVRIKLLDPESR